MKTKNLVATFLCCTLIVQAQEAVVLSESAASKSHENFSTDIKLEAVTAIPLLEIPVVEDSDGFTNESAEMADLEMQLEAPPIVVEEKAVPSETVPSEMAQQETAKKDNQNNTPPQSSEDNTKVVIPSLRGLLLLGSSKSVKVSGLEGVEGVQLDNVDLPGSADSLDKFLSDFWCRPITKQDIIEIKRKVIVYYREHNRPVIHIQVPPQAVKSGVLQLVVYESRMGDVRAIGNKNFSSCKLEGYIRTPRGDRIKADSLINDLNWINRNPFRTTDLIFTPSQTEGYTDIELVTQDQFPLRVYTGVDNTGIAQSGHNRFFAGFNWGNCWGLDHMLTYQFTSGTHYNEFWAHSADYTAPLSWRHTLDIYGGYSEVKANLQGNPGISTTGSSAQASLRYEIPLPPGLSILEEFTWGFDWKRTNTNLLNNDQFFFGKPVNITQLMVGINAGLETARTKNSGTIEVFWSPGQWIPEQQNSHFNDLRAGAKNAYVYGRVSVASIFRLPSNFTFEPSIRYQLSSANLLASEQFGLGGYNTVRGYEEREVNGDNAIIINVELRTPPITLLGLNEKWKRNVTDELRFLIFLDYGYAKNHKRYFNEREFQYLMGAGPGLRYVIQKYLTVRVDYGWKLRQIDFGPNPLRKMLYFAVVASI